MQTVNSFLAFSITNVWKFYRKKYDRAEKDYVDAKLNLHIKQERKELLTEHLMTIIEESEDRKSKRLADLMTKLQIDDKECDI